MRLPNFLTNAIFDRFDDFDAIFPINTLTRIRALFMRKTGSNLSKVTCYQIDRFFWLIAHPLRSDESRPVYGPHSTDDPSKIPSR